MHVSLLKSKINDVEKQIEIIEINDTSDGQGKYDIEKIRFSGFIAQEVESAAQNIGYDFSGVDKSSVENGGLYSLRYSEFVVPLVKAVQELIKENEELKARIERLENVNK